MVHDLKFVFQLESLLELIYNQIEKPETGKKKPATPGSFQDFYIYYRFMFKLYNLCLYRFKQQFKL